jgi:lysophospholipase L1-like esterase
MKERVFAVGLVLASTLFAIALVEAGYRSYLYVRYPEQFIHAEQPRSVFFLSRSIWRFNRDLGFEYDLSRPALAGTVLEGRLTECHEFTSVVNQKTEANGLGPDSDLRIAVFGDSVTAMSVDGLAWTDYLRDELERRLGKKVSVMNFGVDGIGILQMFDWASNRVPRLKPDLVIIAFITDDLTRERIWRTNAVMNGRLRVFTSTRPDEHPDPAIAVDTVVISPDSTAGWCSRVPHPDRHNDAIIRDIEHRHRLAVQLAGNRADVFAKDRSLVLERIVRGTPFRHVHSPSKASVNPRHTLVSFAQDERLKRSIVTIEQAGVPILLMHLAIRAEVRAGKEYVFHYGEDRERLLIQSLEELTQSRVAETLDHLRLPIDDVEAMGVTRMDDHPSRHGMELYSKATAEAILKRGLLVPSAGSTQ